MQKVKLDRIGAEPTIVEVPDDCTCVVDMTCTITMNRMYDTLKKRYVTPKVGYVKYWSKQEDGSWVLHNEPLGELLRMGYLKHDKLQDFIKEAKAEFESSTKQNTLVAY